MAADHGESHQDPRSIGRIVAPQLAAIHYGNYIVGEQSESVAWRKFKEYSAEFGKSTAFGIDQAMQGDRFGRTDFFEQAATSTQQRRFQRAGRIENLRKLRSISGSDPVEDSSADDPASGCNCTQGAPWSAWLLLLGLRRRRLSCR